jgi:uncharacterized membrane protein
MSKVKYPAALFLFVVVISFVLPVVYYKNLPVVIASHFNVRNNTDSWMSREYFLVFQLVVTTLLSVLFLLTTFAIHKLPKSLINLPNKDYWLDDARKDETYSVIQRFMYWFGSLTLMLINAVLLEVYNANISGANKINHIIWIYLIAYLATTGILLFTMIRYFAKPDLSQKTGKRK